MKKYLSIKNVIILLFFIFSKEGISQQTLPDTANYPYWIEMMKDPKANFFQTQKAFNKYFENRDKGKGSGYKVFKRWEYIMRGMISQDGSKPESGQALKEYQKFLNKNKSVAGNWTNLGPIICPNCFGLGRVNTIAFHPTNVYTFYAGAASGGIWKTTNYGVTWSDLTNNLPILNVSSIIVNPVDPNIIYVGTGDKDNSGGGLGIYKSTDGGASWAASNTTMGNVIVCEIIIHPANPAILLAATSSGIFKSTDSGSNWALTSDSLSYKSILFKPGDPSIVYAMHSGMFYRSVDTGNSFTSITLPADNYYAAMAVSPASPEIVYILQANNYQSPYNTIMKSTDSGNSFSVICTSPPNMVGYSPFGGGNQVWYDLALSVDPANANTLFLGGIKIWKSVDGGLNWSESWNDPYGVSVHLDIHYLGFSPSGKLFTGCDGGVYYSYNGAVTWHNVSSGLAISEIYRIGQSASDPDMVLSGYQDNGTTLFNGNSFSYVSGGDGMECIIDYSDTTCIYTSSQNGSLVRILNNNSAPISNNISGEFSGWLMPYILDVNDPNKMFAGYSNVWRTDNVKSVNAADVYWNQLSIGEYGLVVDLKQSSANPDILYVFRGDLKRTDNAYASYPILSTWTQCQIPGSGWISDIETHPFNPDIVYATTGDSVFKSTDKGMSWINITGTLPSVYPQCIVYDKTSNEGLYVGTTNGVFYKDATMTDWISFSNNLPIVNIRELEIYYDNVNPLNNRIRAATYGRGLWSSDLMSSVNTLTSTTKTEDINIFPNPSPGNFTISHNSEKGRTMEVAVFDIAGRKIFEKKYYNDDTHTIDLSYESEGSYFIRVVYKDKVFNKSVVIIR